MSKIAQALIIGFVVAFVVAGGLSFLLVSLGQPPGRSPIVVGVSLGAITALIIASLGANRHTAAASADDRRAALERTPPAGKALVFLVRRGYLAKLVGMNFEVDGIAIAQLKSPQFTCVAVSAGPHNVTASFGGFAQSQSKPGGFALAAAPGAITIIEARMGFGLVQGAIVLTQQTDVAGAKARLASKPLVTPDVGEI
jgi:hypothetical protein